MRYVREGTSRCATTWLWRVLAHHMLRNVRLQRCSDGLRRREVDEGGVCRLRLAHLSRLRVHGELQRPQVLHAGDPANHPPKGLEHQPRGDTEDQERLWFSLFRSTWSCRVSFCLVYCIVLHCFVAVVFVCVFVLCMKRHAHTPLRAPGPGPRRDRQRQRHKTQDTRHKTQDTRHTDTQTHRHTDTQTHSRFSPACKRVRLHSVSSPGSCHSSCL